MLSAGSNIQSQADVLQTLSVEHLANSIKAPKPDILTRIRQLRIIRQVDTKLYAKSKRLLPYFVCSVFNPPLRKTENFAYTSYFVIDLDNLSERQLDLLSVRNWVETDPRVVLSFISPSEDGLKLLFRLKERCYDPGIYKLFYKEFLRRFSTMYRLEQVIDNKTCDVCRACFISVDAEVYYNPEAEEVDMNEYLEKENPTNLFDLKHEQDKEVLSAARKSDEQKQQESSDPADDELSIIKQRLNLKKQQKQEAPKLPIYVPERLEQVMSELKSFIEDQGISVYDVQNIQYGKKIRAKLGNKLGEVNLFYGKRGFRVVMAVKGILSQDMNEALSEIIQLYLSENT